MKLFTKTINNDLFHYVILTIMSIYILAHYMLCTNTALINADASYYIGVTRLLIEGKTPFVDFALSYSPLSFYLMCIPLSIFGSTYTCAITMLYLIHIINAFLVFMILRKETHSNKKAWLGAILFLLFSFLFEGCMYVLEPFVVFFGLIAFLFLRNESFIGLFFVGFFCACSFLCKQYGLGFIILALIYVLVKNNYTKRSVNKILIVLLGFLFSFAIFITCMVVQGIEISQLFSLSGADYERNGLRGLLAACYYLFRKLSPLYISLIISLVYYKKVLKNCFWFVCVIGIVGFMLPCYVRFYKHYLLLALPFMVFLIIYSIQFIKRDLYKRVFVLWIILLSLLPLYSMHNIYQGWCSYRKNQDLLSKQIANYIPEGETNVFLSLNVLYLSLTNSYYPPLICKYGMSNGFVAKQYEVLDLLKNAKYSVINEDDYKNRPSINNIYVKKYLENNFSLKIIKTNDTNSVLLFTKKD